MKKRFFLPILFVLLFWIIPTPHAKAALPGFLPFGGLVSYTLPCTCPATAGSIWIWFTPLYFGPPAPASGPLVYVPGASQLFSWYMIGVPGSWHLGSYTPGVQACWMIVPPPGVGCFPWPALGTIIQVGTSKPI